jgi:hypothetical protein
MSDPRCHDVPPPASVLGAAFVVSSCFQLPHRHSVTRQPHLVREPHVDELDQYELVRLRVHEPRQPLPTRTTHLHTHPHGCMMHELRPLHTRHTRRLILRRVRMLRRMPLVLRHEGRVRSGTDTYYAAPRARHPSTGVGNHRARTNAPTCRGGGVRCSAGFGYVDRQTGDKSGLPHKPERWTPCRRQWSNVRSGHHREAGTDGSGRSVLPGT